jgi:hypothetical protein
MDQQLSPVATAGKLITTKDAAKLLRKHVKTLEKWRSEGKGPRYYQPEGERGSVWYLEHEVIAYVRGGVA